VSADSDAVPVRDLLAANLKRLRLEGSATPDDVARAARSHGLEWTASWVGSVERGQKQLTAEQLVALPFVLTDVLGHRVSLADLLHTDEPVLLTRPAASRPPPVSAAYLHEVLTSAGYRRHFNAPGVPATPPDPAASATQRAAAKMREIGRAGLGNVDVRALAKAEAGATDVEEKLARKLGVAPIVVIAASAALWGRSLTEERNDRLSPDPYAESETPGPKPAAVMRKLTAEIAARLEQAAQSLPEPAPQVAPAPVESTVDPPVDAPTQELPRVPAPRTPVDSPRSSILLVENPAATS